MKITINTPTEQHEFGKIRNDAAATLIETTKRAVQNRNGLTFTQIDGTVVVIGPDVLACSVVAITREPPAAPPPIHEPNTFSVNKAPTTRPANSEPNGRAQAEAQAARRDGWVLRSVRWLWWRGV